MTRLSSLLLLLPTVAFGWPLASEWAPLQGPVSDLSGDFVGTDNALDLEGTGAAPALSWYADASDVYLRLQLAGDPAPSGSFKAFTWGVLLDTDGDASSFEFLIASSGVTTLLEAYSNDGTAGVAPPFTAYTHLAVLDGNDSVRRDEDGAHFYLDLRVSRAELNSVLGIGDVDPLRFVPFTGPSVYTDRSDIAGCDNTSACTDLSSLLSDAVTIDRDEDGLTDPQEALLGADPDDQDSDDDGIIDGSEALGDADGDGTVDVLDCDSDDDGILDGTEAGLIAIDLSADTDTTVGCFLPDLDTVAAPTNPYAWDSDGGGLGDGLEDWNYNGRIDGSWETDPNDPSDDLDTDGDGIADVLELQGADANVNDVDSDGDGLTDASEWLWDSDSDGVPDFLDTDSDDDRVPDSLEGDGDTDGDGVPDYLDLDSDGDGIGDSVEGGADSDGDGTPDFQDSDSDGDGIPDAIEGADDTDNDGTPDYLDDDTDGDGIPDAVEGADDADDDGLGNYEDTDSDDDGIPDEVEGDVDSDGDGTPDFLDPNSDGDGILDRDEGTGDVDCDGIPNYIDPIDDDAFCDTGAGVPDVDDDGFDPIDNGDRPLFGKGAFTGGACSVVPSSSLGLSGLLAGLVVLMRRRRRLAGVGLALAAATPAAAQSVNAQRFSPSVDNDALIRVEEATVAPAGSSGVGLWFNWADDPFVFRPDDPNQTELDVLGTATSLDLAGFYSLGGLRVGADLPLHVYAAGLSVDSPVNMGDLRLSSKLALPLELPVQLGAALDATLPTGAATNWLGADAATVRAALLASMRPAQGPVLLASNLGMRSGTGRDLGDLSVSPAFTYGLGADYAINDVIGVTGELEGDLWLGNSGQSGGRPLEWLASLHATPTPHWLARVGLGSGLTQGVGAPDFRVVAGLGWRGGPKATEPAPAVVSEAPAPPPAAPARGHLVVRALSPAGDPISGAEVRIIGGLGAPMSTGRDGILEADLAPGDWEITVAAEGWAPGNRKLQLSADDTVDVMMVLRPKEQVMVDAARGKIYTHRKVFFELDKAELAVNSFDVLDELVKTLGDHPEISLLRVEGHTDITGTEAHNLELSQRRAQSVVSYLVRAGVPTARLQAKGMGESRPLQQGESEAIHATNRRVEFHIVK